MIHPEIYVLLGRLDPPCRDTLETPYGPGKYVCSAAWTRPVQGHARNALIRRLSAFRPPGPAVQGHARNLCEKFRCISILVTASYPSHKPSDAVCHRFCDRFMPHDCLNHDDKD